MASQTKQIGSPTGRAAAIMADAHRNACVMICERTISQIELSAEIKRTRAVVAENLGRRIAEERDEIEARIIAIDALERWI